MGSSRSRIALIAAVATVFLRLCAPAGAATEAIVGGQPANYSDWPWAVALYNTGQFECSGTLVRPNWVLTASHCVLDDPFPGDYDVVAGSASRTDPNAEVIGVRQIVVHPGASCIPWNGADSCLNVNNDFALLKLRKSSHLATPIALPTNNAPLAPGTTVQAAGWGVTNANGNGNSVDHLQTATFSVTSDGGGIMDAKSPTAEACYGDSGGPWVVRTDPPVLVGLTSEGPICPPGGDNFQASLTSSWNMLWIESVIGPKPRSLVKNGNFEDKPFAANPVSPDLTSGLSKWTINDGNVDYYSGLLQSADDFEGAAGRQALDLNGNTAGTISQTIKLKPGRSYQIRYWIAGAESTQQGSGCTGTGAEAVKHLSVFFHPAEDISAGPIANVTFTAQPNAFTDMNWRYDVFTVNTAPTDPPQWTLAFKSGSSGVCGPALDGVVVVPL